MHKFDRPKSCIGTCVKNGKVKKRLGRHFNPFRFQQLKIYYGDDLVNLFFLKTFYSFRAFNFEI